VCRFKRAVWVTQNLTRELTAARAKTWMYVGRWQGTEQMQMNVCKEGQVLVSERSQTINFFSIDV